VNKEASQELFEEQVKPLEEQLLVARGWTVFNRTYPVLDVGFERQGRVPIRIRLQCDDWNELPPAIALLSWNGERLKQLPSGPSSVFTSSPHPLTGQPFICMIGAREYHTHSSHTSDAWANYKTRSGFDLGGILHQLWLFWLKTTP
jgi:hypothetical protein